MQRVSDLHHRLPEFWVRKNESGFMQRSELEHIIRASGDIANDDEIVIIGSQSILGQFPNAPALLLASMETDLYPKNKPELADKVDDAIGEGSSYHELHGYYDRASVPRLLRCHLTGKIA